MSLLLYDRIFAVFMFPIGSRKMASADAGGTADAVYVSHRE